MNGGFGETGEDRSQVFAHGDVPTSAGFDDGEDGGDFRSGLLAADVDPVFASIEIFRYSQLCSLPDYVHP
jgi:hypothetical protein